MNWNSVDWNALERMRAAFLAGTAGAQDYWQSLSDVASYDLTFAQRISWKWDFVLNELKRRGWAPPLGEVLDWGCGSGVAGRTLMDHFPKAIQSLVLHDRSPLATRYAAQRARERFPKLNVRVDSAANPGTLLLSHVITELTPEQLESLAATIRKAAAVLWVEPGTYDASRALVAMRERLRGEFNLIAPCTHQAPCGLNVPENARHWCHHFASPPPEIFMDSNWGRFAHLAGIDLRSLPVSYLVLDRRPAPALPANSVRILGRPRVYKAHALLMGCDASGVHERELTKRALPEQFRELKKDRCSSLQSWELKENQITSAKPLAE